MKARRGSCLHYARQLDEDIAYREEITLGEIYIPKGGSLFRGGAFPAGWRRWLIGCASLVGPSIRKLIRSVGYSVIENIYKSEIERLIAPCLEKGLLHTAACLASPGLLWEA